MKILNIFKKETKNSNKTNLQVLAQDQLEKVIGGSGTTNTTTTTASTGNGGHVGAVKWGNIKL